MTARYEVRTVHLTAIEKRFFPEQKDKPFVVWDTKHNRPVGRRFGTKSGAHAAAHTRNARRKGNT